MLNNELRNSPFTTPENYFDSLPSKIQEKCIVSRRSPKIRFVPRLAFAGVAALMLTLFFSDLNNTSELKNSNIQTAEAEIQEKNLESKSKVTLDDYLKTTSEKFKSDAMIDYMALRNVNVNEILLARY